MVPIPQRQWRQRQRQQTTQLQTKMNDNVNPHSSSAPFDKSIIVVPRKQHKSLINILSTRPCCSRRGQSRPMPPPPPGHDNQLSLKARALMMTSAVNVAAHSGGPREREGASRASRPTPCACLRRRSTCSRPCCCRGLMEGRGGGGGGGKRRALLWTAAAAPAPSPKMIIIDAVAVAVAIVWRRRKKIPAHHRHRQRVAHVGIPRTAMRVPPDVEVGRSSTITGGGIANRRMTKTTTPTTTTKERHVGGRGGGQGRIIIIRPPLQVKTSPSRRTTMLPFRINCFGNRSRYWSRLHYLTVVNVLRRCHERRGLVSSTSAGWGALTALRHE
jgi:hypothetical protein